MNFGQIGVMKWIKLMFDFLVSDKHDNSSRLTWCCFSYVSLQLNTKVGWRASIKLYCYTYDHIMHVFAGTCPQTEAIVF